MKRISHRHVIRTFCLIQSTKTSFMSYQVGQLIDGQFVIVTSFNTSFDRTNCVCNVVCFVWERASFLVATVPNECAQKLRIEPRYISCKKTITVSGSRCPVFRFLPRYGVCTYVPHEMASKPRLVPIPVITHGVIEAVRSTHLPVGKTSCVIRFSRCSVVPPSLDSTIKKWFFSFHIRRS